MRQFGFAFVLIAAVVSFRVPCHSAENQHLVFKNSHLTVTFANQQSRLVIVSLLNRRSGQRVPLSNSDGFLLGIGKAEPDTPRQWLGLRDFVVRNWSIKGNEAEFDLENDRLGLVCRWRWSVADGPYVRTWLEIQNKGKEPISIADVDVLALNSSSNLRTEPLVAAEADSDNHKEAPATSAWSAIDGDPNTHWIPAQTPEPHWLELTFAKPVDVSRIVVRPEPADTDPSRFHLHAIDANGKMIDIAPGSSVKRLRIDEEGSEQPYKRLGIAELEVYDANGARLPLIQPGEVPVQRSTGIGYGEGVALLWNGSAFAALEALLYDYRLGVSQDGNAFRVGHNPGWILGPGENATSKKAVLGVAPLGEAGHWFVTKYLQKNWRQHKQGDHQFDRYWGYNITSDEDWSLGTSDMETLARALKKTKEAYGFGFHYVGPDITALVSYDPYRLGVNRDVFPDGLQATAAAIASTGAAVEGYYGIGRPAESETPEARKRYRDTLTAIVERDHIKMLIFDGYVGRYNDDQPYVRERVWDNFRETVEALQAQHPDLFVGVESFSPNTLTRWLWVNTQFDHHASHYLKYNPDAKLNNVRAELIPDAGAGSAPVLHGRDVVTASAGVYDLFGVPWRGVETFGPLWQLIYNPVYQGASAMERSRDNWVMNLFGAATILSPVTYGRIFGQPPEDMEWLGRMLQLRDQNLTVFAACKAKENGDIFHVKDDHGFAVFRNLRWATNVKRSFALDDGIGLTARDREFIVKQIYPVERVLTRPDGSWKWHYGEHVSVNLDPFQVKLVSIAPVSAVAETVATGCSYERHGRNDITLLGLPGDSCQMHSQDGRNASTVSFEGTYTAGQGYARIGELVAFSDAERREKQDELLSRVDFVKAVAYPKTWRASNIYGLLDYEKEHPYPYPEIEAARRINEKRMRDSMKWFTDNNLETPPVPTEAVSITHAPIVFGRSVIQADLASVRRIGRISVAVREKPPALTVSFSADGKAWSSVPLSMAGDDWESGNFDRMARYLRLNAELTVEEFKVFTHESGSSEQLLDWSVIDPYPISFVSTLTTPGQIANAWSIHFRLPEKTYEGEKVAIPIWLAQPARVSELWPLYRIDGQERAAYDVVPGYAKDASASPEVMGLTFRIPLHPADGGKQLDIVVVSAQPLKRAEAWIDPDPLPYIRKHWAGTQAAAWPNERR